MAEKMSCVVCGKKSFTCAECQVRAGNMRLVAIKTNTEDFNVADELQEIIGCLNGLDATITTEGQRDYLTKRALASVGRAIKKSKPS